MAICFMGSGPRSCRILKILTTDSVETQQTNRLLCEIDFLKIFSQSTHQGKTRSTKPTEYTNFQLHKIPIRFSLRRTVHHTLNTHYDDIEFYRLRSQSALWEELGTAKFPGFWKRRGLTTNFQETQHVNGPF